VRAEQYFVAAVARGFPADRAMPVLVRVCLAGDRLRAALEHAVPYLSRHPRDFPLRDLVATIRFALGDASGAARELEDSLAVAPERASSRYLLAVVLRDGLRDPAGAARAFAAYLAAEPDGTHAAEARSWLAEHGRATPGETGRGRVPMGAPRREN
jgi:predicted Zn-dependent protease